MLDLPAVPCAPDRLNHALVGFSALQRRAAAASVKLRMPPAAPTSCCGRGCNGCIWEAWYSAVDDWHEEALRQLPS